ncbi:cysteine-rich receptor-like protein kinase 8 [Tanacetum coccineum]
MAPSASSSTTKPTPLALFQNPLYLHPSDGPSSLTVQEKLTGAQNYRAWRRAIEIGLSTKRKLGFVKGTVVRSATDENLAEFKKEEKKLFQLLNGLEELLGHSKKCKLVMIDPFLSVEVSCSLLQQEES